MTMIKICTIIILLFSLCGEAYAYCVMSCSSCGCQQSGTGWQGATATFQSKGFSGSDSTFDDAFVEALNNWNNLSNFSYSSTDSSADPCNDRDSPNLGDGIPSWKFDSTNCGSAFGSTVLAITMTVAESFTPSINNIIDADIVFNTAFSWDVHNGSGSNSDFRRVATHELGHALGLDHEDDVPSILNTNISHTIEVPQPDDIDGLIALYGGSSTTLDPPTGFTASADGSTLSLSWNAVSGAEGYYLYYGYSSGNYAGPVNLGNTTSTSFSNVPDGTYYIAVTAYAGPVESDYSDEESVTFSTTVNLSAPTGFTASASGSTLSLSWNAVSGAEGYNLYYGYSSGNYAGPINLGNTTSQTFNGIPDGTYYLAVTAYAGTEESGYSGEESATVYSEN